MTATFEHGDERSTLRFERRLRHAPERVWRAVTDPGELRAWFPAEVIYEQRAGAPMQFDFGGMHGEDVWPGEVLEWDPPRAFSFAWGEDVLRFELAPGDAGPDTTILVFTHSFAHQPGKPARDAAGWETCFEAFDALLAGQAAANGPDRWRDHHETYLGAFGELTVEAGGTWRRVRLQGPYQRLDGRPAVNVSLGDDGAAVLVVRDSGGELADGAPVEVRAGSVQEPGAVVLRGVLHDPQAVG